MDAIRECGLNIENMDKTLCYSFVLQHPENRIVVPFNYPCLYLVAVYHIERKEDENVIVTPYENNEICALGSPKPSPSSAGWQSGMQPITRRPSCRKQNYKLHLKS